jgi:uncharacterized protein involved in outer membrane biogenesis
LPTPVLSLADIRWGEDGNRPVFSAETLTLEIATGPLLKGEIQIIDASLEAGRLDLRYDKAGGLALLGGLAPDSGSHAVAVERFALKRSTVLIEDETSGGGLILTGLDLELQAGALQGPWRISGRGALDGRPVDVRLSTSAPEEDGSLRLVTSVVEEGGRSLYFDGRVQPDDHKLAGQFTLVDRIGKKIKVVNEVAAAIQLKNVTTHHGRVETIQNKKFDFAVSRAVAPLGDLWQWIQGSLKTGHKSEELPNGLICLKGGDLNEEINASGLAKIVQAWEVNKIFPEPAFDEKFVIYVPKLH